MRVPSGLPKAARQPQEAVGSEAGLGAGVLHGDSFRASRGGGTLFSAPTHPPTLDPHVTQVTHGVSESTALSKLPPLEPPLEVACLSAEPLSGLQLPAVRRPLLPLPVPLAGYVPPPEGG